MGPEPSGAHQIVTCPGPPGRLPVRVALRSPFPVDRLELVQNGKAILSFALEVFALAMPLFLQLTVDRVLVGRK